MVKKVDAPLVIVLSGRNGAKDSRFSKLMQLPRDTYAEIEQRSEGPMNQVLVELIELGWRFLKRRGKPLVVGTKSSD